MLVLLKRTTGLVRVPVPTLLPTAATKARRGMVGARAALLRQHAVRTATRALVKTATIKERLPTHPGLASPTIGRRLNVALLNAPGPRVGAVSVPRRRCRPTCADGLGKTTAPDVRRDAGAPLNCSPCP